MQNRSLDPGSSSAPRDDIDEKQLRTLWCGGISEKVDEEILYELFLNAGPLENVIIPRDWETKKQRNYAFIVFQHEESTEYAFNLLNGTELFRKAIKLQNKETGLGMGHPICYNNFVTLSGRHYRSFSAVEGGRDRDRNHMRSATAPVGVVQFGGQYGGQHQQPNVWGGGGYGQQHFQATYGYGTYNPIMNSRSEYNNNISIIGSEDTDEKVLNDFKDPTKYAAVPTPYMAPPPPILPPPSGIQYPSYLPVSLCINPRMENHATRSMEKESIIIDDGDVDMKEKQKESIIIDDRDVDMKEKQKDHEALKNNMGGEGQRNDKSYSRDRDNRGQRRDRDRTWKRRDNRSSSSDRDNRRQRRDYRRDSSRDKDNRRKRKEDRSYSRDRDNRRQRRDERRDYSKDRDRSCDRHRSSSRRR